MTDAATFLRDTLYPGTKWCEAIPGWNIPFDDRADVLLLAIAGQESGLTARVQGGSGPAHGFWQFERAGAVTDVLTHCKTYKLAMVACAASGVPANPKQAWGLMATEKGDNLAVAFARLLLWTDQAPLPGLLDDGDAWNFYLGLWRPGKPRPKDWPGNYQATLAAVKATPL